MEQRIERARQRVGRKAPRNAGKRRRNTRNGMPPNGIKNDAAQWNDEHVSGIDSAVRDQTDQYDHGRHERLGRPGKRHLDAGIEVARLIGYPDTQHGHEHHAQRCKASEDGHHLGEEGRHRIPGQQVVDDDGCARARIDVGK